MYKIDTNPVGMSPTMLRSYSSLKFPKCEAIVPIITWKGSMFLHSNIWKIFNDNSGNKQNTQKMFCKIGVLTNFKKQSRENLLKTYISCSCYTVLTTISSMGTGNLILALTLGLIYSLVRYIMIIEITHIITDAQLVSVILLKRSMYNWK